MEVIGNPVASTCLPGSAFVPNGCLAGDYTYTLTIESSGVPFGEVRFRVLDPSGTPLVVPGNSSGFSIINISGSVSAEYSTAGRALNMTSDWSYASQTSPSTILNNLYTIVVDMGTANPAGRGFTFAASFNFTGLGWESMAEVTLP